MSLTRIISADLLSSEIVFTTSRSSGPGGQNVNKVNSRVTLKFDVEQSSILTAEEKQTIRAKFAKRITNDGVLLIHAQEKRSQLQNREEAVEKFNALMKKAFEKRKPRKKTKPSKGAVQERIKQKKVRSEKKKWRRRPLDS